MAKRRKRKPTPIADSDDELTEEDDFYEEDDIVEKGDLIWWMENDEIFAKVADAADVAKWGINGTERTGKS